MEDSLGLFYSDGNTTDSEVFLLLYIYIYKIQIACLA